MKGFDLSWNQRIYTSNGSDLNLIVNATSCSLSNLYLHCFQKVKIGSKKKRYRKKPYNT